MNSRSARKKIFELLWIAIIVTVGRVSLPRFSSARIKPPLARKFLRHKLPPPPQLLTPLKAKPSLLRSKPQMPSSPPPANSTRPHLQRSSAPMARRSSSREKPPRTAKEPLGFAAEAKEKTKVVVDPKTGTRAFIIVGDEDWPFAVPIIKVNGKWSFDAKAGEQELLYRRIGSNELDAIQICRGFVESQDEYALRSRQLYNVNQYAQRIISTPGKQDGLTWQTANGTWEGPIGEPIAKAIAEGYTSREMPFHGYFYKVLKGQGPAAPLGQLDYVIEGVMIGGFALVAAPAQYRVTGVKTFIVSYDGVVYEKDLGPDTTRAIQKDGALSTPTYPGIPLTTSEDKLDTALLLFG